MKLRRILVVEDDSAQAETLAELLRHWGYQSDIAQDGVEALSKMESESPNLVIADLRMPRLNGLGLLWEVRHNFPHVPCILISGQGTLDEAVEGISLGAYRFLEKPLDPDRLRLEIRSCLQENFDN